MIKKIVPILLILLYLVTHFYQLTLLPVFADEAIYIRWAQLIMDDWSRYLFFPLNDGKTPLFIWLLVPFQYLFKDQLYAGRFLAVLVGLFQVLLNGYLAKQLGARKKTVWLAMLLTIVLPYWYFHHRVALIDGLMTLFMTTTLIGLLKISFDKKSSPSKHYCLLLLTGLSFGLAILTKIPAVLAIPSFYLMSLIKERDWSKNLFKQGLFTTLVVVIGLLTFLTMKLHPAFGQLFSRGSDFLYPWSEVLFHGLWRQTVINIPTYLSYFVAYLGWPLLLLNIYGLFSPTQKKTQWLLIISAVFFALPMMILGRVVYPRYFLPVAIFLTLSATLAIQEIVDLYITRQKKLPQKTGAAVILVTLIASLAATAFNFIYPSLTKPDQIPFVSADQFQYLTEWSSGHGIKEVSAYLLATAKTKKVAAATEGFFGTLPDGILLYLHNQNVTNLYVEGIGQPVRAIPAKFSDRAQNYDQILLVVNSHRLGMHLEPNQLLKQYCRPFQAPCLQVWDITQNVKPVND